MHDSYAEKNICGPVITHEEQDASELAALEATCFCSAWSAGQYADALQDLRHLILVLRNEQGICAYVVLYHVLDELEILNIGTHPEYRRMGLAARLLQHVQEILCPQYGIRRIVLDVRPSNTPAVNLYARFNFVEAGRRRRYYAPDGEDALILEWVFPG